MGWAPSMTVDSSHETLLDQIKQEFEGAVARFDSPKDNQHVLRTVISKLREWNGHDMAVSKESFVRVRL